jgi:hypothetical protein
VPSFYHSQTLFQATVPRLAEKTFFEKKYFRLGKNMLL